MADKKISQLNAGNPAQGTDQIPISRSGQNFQITAQSIADLAAGSGVTSITGTADQVIASASTGNVTLSLPQNLNTTSSPTFDGLTLTDDLAMGSNTITNLADPVNAQDAATKIYVDEVAEGLRAKPAARAATTANLAAIYDNGVSGVGATLTADTDRAFTSLDGVTSWAITTPPMGVLVKNQTNPAHNGRYNLTALGEAGVSPWVLTRCSLCDTASEIPGAYTFVQFGTVNGGTGWVQTVADPDTFVVGTDAITVVQFSGAGTYTAGTGLSLTGNQFAVAGQVLALENLSVNGLVARTASNVLTPRTLTASTGISVSNGDGVSGNPTITNTAPDQTVVLTAGTGISTSGTYPNFTITNSAPDQTVALTAGSGISVTGTYPNFTIAASGGSGVTSIAGSNGLTASASTGAVTLSLNSDLRGNVSAVGLDSGDYISWTNNSHTSFFVNGAERGRLENDGDWHADGNVVAYSTTISDERLKQNVVLVENAIDTIKQLNGVTFEYIKDGRKSAGVIAQQLEKVFPSAVKETKSPFFLPPITKEDGTIDHEATRVQRDNSPVYKIVEYSQLTALFIEAIKELSDKVAALEAKLNSGA
jgi:hypothetical protein